MTICQETLDYVTIMRNVKYQSICTIDRHLVGSAHNKEIGINKF